MSEREGVQMPDVYATISEADAATQERLATILELRAADPQQVCIEAVKAAFINDMWLVRRLPSLLPAAGFELLGTRSHGYLQTSQPEYMLTLVDRGADTLAASARVGPELCAALKAEARRRADDDRFYGSIGFTSFIARKPA
jgi:hypothetical protein